jgi:polyisoprenoid-binding protein YceI
VIFSISHFGFTNFYGSFSCVTGGLQLDTAAPAKSKLVVTIPVHSIFTTVPALTEQLKGDQWFDAAKFPDATFTSTRVVGNGPDSATIIGDFALHGVTKSVTLSAHLVGSGVNPLDKATTAGIEATGTIKRSEFGLKQYLPLLGDDVHLTLVGAFELEP